MELTGAALLFGAGLLAGGINALAGGGSFLTLAALAVAADLPVGVANGTNRVAVLVQSLAALLAFGKAGRAEWGLALRLAPATVLGAGLGAQLSLELPRSVLEMVVGVAMLGMIGVVLLRPKRFLEGAARAPRLGVGLVDLAFFAIGVYGGFLQAGVGVFLLIALVGLAGRDLVRANVAKVVLALVFTVPALGVFLAQGAVAWAPGLVLAAGAGVGGALGARAAVKGGSGLVRVVLIAVLLVSAARFLGKAAGLWG